MFASLETSDDRSFTIEKCHQDFVVKEFNMTSEEEELEEEEDFIPYPEEEDDDSEADIIDPDKMATFSIMFYYTQAFEDTTPDMEGFIDNILVKTNQGYKYSLLPITATKHLMEKATIEEVDSTKELLDNFRDMKGGDLSKLRNSADIAVLLVAADMTNSCGRAKMFGWKTGETIAVVEKECARNKFTLGHEIGHIFGAQHHRHDYTSYDRDSIYFGHWIDKVSHVCVQRKYFLDSVRKRSAKT